ncbi:AMP-binding protein [Anaerosporobacter sp.]
MYEQSLPNNKLSVERPWMKYYPEQFQHIELPYCSLNQYLKQSSRSLDNPVIEYYGNILTWNDIFTKVDIVAKALKNMGCKENDRIPVFLQSVPEFVLILLAAEKIGAAVVCRDGLPEENTEAIKQTNSQILFAHDYLSKEEEELYYKETNLKHIIKISPYNMTNRDKIPSYIVKNIESKYREEVAFNSDNLTWEEFESLGKSYVGEYKVSYNPSRPVFCAYTSGSTGPSKQVIHSSANIVGMIHQTAVYTAVIQIHLSWLMTCLPPALVAVTVAMILTPIASNQLLILDPYCAVEDVDLELMKHKPNCWPLIPQFIDVLVNSDRIPKDFSLEHLYCVGSGAEALNNKQIKNFQKFLKDHKCNSFFSVGYGMSEGGSGFTMPCEAKPLESCCCGIPMPATIIGIFNSKTNEEVAAGQLGEICKNGPGIMLSYQDEESTHKVLQRHEDGKVWMHTGDYGYMTEDGVLYVMGRGLPERVTRGYLFAVPMENKICDIEGIHDAFFVIADDLENEGYYLPYLYLVLEDGVRVEELQDQINNALEPHERPVKITIIDKRPYFHFKTNRRGLAAEIVAM